MNPLHIDVLIVTAADGEDDAVRAVTAGATSAWREAQRPPGYDFAIWIAEFASKSGKPLRVALTRAARMGVESAGNAAAVLVAHYRPQCLAMCGVCAGRPGWTSLGDVIIAEHVYRYDVGELVNDVPGAVPRFNGDLLTFPFRANWKQAAERYEVPHDTPWLAERPVPRPDQEDWVLDELLAGRNPVSSTDRAKRCADWKDVTRALREDGLIVLEGSEPKLTSDGQRRAEEHRFEHPDGFPIPNNLRVHVRPLATGSNLVRDVDIWEKLATNQRLIHGLDMEASVIGFAGFVAERPWIVAKGVMDFAEPGRGQGFRKFAARAAAEVLIGFLRENLAPGAPGPSDILRPGTAIRPAGLKNPATLLTARYEVIPFVESARAEELREIRKWCDDAAAVSARLFLGPGGAGKTRLFIEVAKKLREQGWDAGFLPESAIEEDERTALAGGRSTLIVIDYAEARRDLSRLLEAAATRGLVEGRKIRIALVAREVADWWQMLLQAAAPVVDLLRTHAPVELRAEEVLEAQRGAVFERAAAVFAKELGKPAPAQAPDLTHPRFGRMLYLAMAALASAFDSDLRPDQLLHETLEHEKRYVTLHCFEASAASPAHKADWVDKVARLLAATTLRGSVASRDEAGGLSLRVRGPNEATSPNIYRGLHALYGQTSSGVSPDGAVPYLAAVEPDLLGEELVAQVLSSAETPSDFLVQTFEGVSEAIVRRGLLVLGRIGARNADARYRRWIAAVLDPDVPGRARAALDAALTLTRETAHAPLGQVLHAALEREGTVAIARVILPLVPDPTVALQEVSVWAAQRVLSATDDDAVEERAGILATLSQRLSQVGRYEDALAAAEQARAAYRSLAASRPDAFLPERAAILSALGERLSHLGRWEDALVATNEAIRYLRGLALVQSDGFLRELATSLNNLGEMLSHVGRHEEALAASDEAVRHRTALAAARPEVFLSDLAMSLNNLAIRHFRLGRREEALTASEDAVRKYRTLAGTRPDAFLPHLAKSLNNLGEIRSNLGRYESALPAAHEAVRHHRTLAADRPGVFLPDLAMSLNNLGIRLASVGRREDALAATMEAVEYYRSLAGARPDSFRSNLAMSLDNLSLRLLELGRREDALASAEESVGLYRKLAAVRPHALFPELAQSLNTLGVALFHLGRREHARLATEEAIRHRRSLVAVQPEAFPPDLAASLNNLSEILAHLGRHDDALRAAEEAVLLTTALARVRPELFAAVLAARSDLLRQRLTQLGRDLVSSEAWREADAFSAIQTSKVP